MKTKLFLVHIIICLLSIHTIDLSGQSRDSLGQALFARFETLSRPSSVRANKHVESRQGRSLINTYDVGNIPLVADVSPSGARTYSVSIQTAPNLHFVPQVAITYNSQAGNGYAGWGWDLSGLSEIAIASKTPYYDNTAEAADIADTSAVFSLDGVRLVQNSDENYPTYQYETAHGHILVRKHIAQDGRITHFSALYPDGSQVVYGFPSDSVARDLYPVHRMRDKEGNLIVFTYSGSGAQHSVLGESVAVHLQKIEYGFREGETPSARILFETTNRTDGVDRMSAGNWWHDNAIISSVSSYNDGELLCRYDLSYESAHGMTLLKTIGCSSGTHSLPPVEFQYGADTCIVSPSLSVSTTVIPATAFVEHSDGFVYLRGKFVPGEFNDGVIAYPKYSNYALLPGNSMCGSLYPVGGKILVVPSIKEGEIFCEVLDDITFGSGFQALNAMDVDRDGTDEIIKVNYAGFYVDKTVVSVTIYKYSLDNNSFTSDTFSFFVEGKIVSGWLDYSPYFRIFEWGDFLGTGGAQLLMMATNMDFRGNSHLSKTVLVDVTNKTKLTEEVVFDLSDQRIVDVLALDYDSDSKCELCYLDGNVMKVYESNSNGHFSFKRDVQGIGQSLFARSDDHEVFLTDINGDGYIDIVERNASSNSDILTAHSFTGQRYVSTSCGSLPPIDGCDYCFIDVNHDGLPDMVRAVGTTLGVFLNNRGWISSTFIPDTNGVQDQKGLVPCNLHSLHSASGFIKHNRTSIDAYSFTINQAENRLINSSTDGFGLVTTNIYQRYPEAKDESIQFENEYTISDTTSFREITGDFYVMDIESVADSNSSGNTYLRLAEHRFFHPVVNTRGLGFCGFERHLAIDFTALATIITDSRVDPERLGVPVSASTYVSDTLVKSSSYSYDTHSTTYGKLNPRLIQSTEADHLTGVTTSTSVSGYDVFDCPSTVTCSRTTGSGLPQMETKRLTYSHCRTDSLYVLGGTIEEVHESELDGNLNNSYVVKTTTEYDGHRRPVEVKNYVTDNNSLLATWHLLGTKRLEYDVNGNVTSAKTAAYGATTYNETTYSYDAAGRYIRSETDPLGRTTTYQSYNRYGQPAVVSNRLTQETQYGYDCWGRKISCFYPEGTDEYTSYAWSVSGEPGLYCISKTVTGQPDTKVWYDALGREVRSANKRFDGSWQYVTTEYDGRGRLYRTSLPYKDTAAGPTLWNTYTYDNYNRPVSLLEASSKQTTWSYSGTSTTTTKEGMSSTSTTDAEGNVVNVTDAGGTISYTIRDDGQPSSVTVTPAGTNQNIVTSFTYDVYGRRTAIVDPSAGTRSEIYTDNTDGSSSVAHTGPNGTVTTCYDRFGRVTSVTRPEFNTSYTYGTTLYDSSYGKLLSEVSTNGTSRAFTYDGYGRPVTETEHADSTNWLRRTYTYGSGSKIATVNYTTQDGSITTETFSYANGHHTGTTLQNWTTTFSLLSENALGQPTEVWTGMVQRLYGYTAAGIPSRRRMYDEPGTLLQDFEYSYYSSTGNMAWRKDNVLEMREDFYYDGLNRLITATQTLPAQLDTMNMVWRPYERGTINVSLDAKGNVLGKQNLSMSYANQNDPYQNTHAVIDYGDWVDDWLSYFSVTTTSFDRPAAVLDAMSVQEGETPTYATYTYNASGQKVKSTQGANGISRVYLGDGVYEKDERSYEVWSDDLMEMVPCTETIQRLFLGGNAYDAPMVLVKVDNGSWTPYNIGRDVQGSITHVATHDGTLKEVYYYDPWGSVVPMDSNYYSVDTLAVLFPMATSLYSKIIGSHGYTGHEIIAGLGVYNANARFYDPVTGRFLAPDPLIQDPASTQNFNRYSYCLNNPLKYTDESGEFAFSTLFAVTCVSAIVFGLGNTIAQDNRGELNSFQDGLRYFTQGLITGAALGATFYLGWSLGGPIVRDRLEYLLSLHIYTTVAGVLGDVSENGWARAREISGKIFLGNFYLDENEFWRGAWHGYLRHTYELLQTGFGYDYSMMRNVFSPVDRVDYLGGTTFVTDENSNDQQGVSIGNYANIDIYGQIGSGSFDSFVTSTPLYMHEYGHTIDSHRYGPLYLFAIGVPSLFSAQFSPQVSWTSAITGRTWTTSKHRIREYEMRANRNAKDYFSRYYGVNWDIFEDRYPTEIL